MQAYRPSTAGQRLGGHPIDRLIAGFDQALRVVAGVAASARPSPAAHVPDVQMSEAERKHSAGLIRVDHVGEVCAQGLYHAQAQFAQTQAMRSQCEQAAREEEDHLAWTQERLRELNSRPSLLNPLWYAGSYVLGSIAARLGDRRSLGFIVETERQVEAHLVSHLRLLPQQDAKSRAIVEQMRVDEIVHGNTASDLGAELPPAPVQKAMAAMAKVMTSTAYYV